jgi:hypothetical protein
MVIPVPDWHPAQQHDPPVSASLDCGEASTTKGVSGLGEFLFTRTESQNLKSPSRTAL